MDYEEGSKHPLDSISLPHNRLFVQGEVGSFLSEAKCHPKSTLPRLWVSRDTMSSSVRHYTRERLRHHPRASSLPVGCVSQGSWSVNYRALAFHYWLVALEPEDQCGGFSGILEFLFVPAKIWLVARDFWRKKDQCNASWAPSPHTRGLYTIPWCPLSAWCPGRRCHSQNVIFGDYFHWTRDVWWSGGCFLKGWWLPPFSIPSLCMVETRVKYSLPIFMTIVAWKYASVLLRV